jgi:hypothetical protein
LAAISRSGKIPLMSQKLRTLTEVRESAVKLSRIEQALALACLVPPRQDAEVGTGLASDVLSQVLARASQGCILVTTQHNLNLIAVASHTEIAGVIITSGYRPGTEVLSRARAEGIGLYVTPLETFDVVGKLCLLGIRGRQK